MEGDLSPPSPDPFADAGDPGATRLPRRIGFFVRHRARLGLLPGQVSTAALVQARRWRWGLVAAVPILAIIALLPLAALTSGPTDQPARIAVVAGPQEIQTGIAPFVVVLDDGRTIYFEHDPQVRTGQSVLVRSNDGDTATVFGLVVDGSFVPSIDDAGSSTVAGAVFSTFFVIAIAAFVMPMVVWGRRTYRQLRSDLRSPVLETRGRYLGSWTWRGMTNRIHSRSGNLAQVAGFPIAIETAPGQVGWYGAPIWMVSEIRHFETAIASTSREVIVSFHPATRALARLATPDGSASLDLQGALDDLHPEVGLSLKVSRRRRQADLPDR